MYACLQGYDYKVNQTVNVVTTETSYTGQKTRGLYEKNNGFGFREG